MAASLISSANWCSAQASQTQDPAGHPREIKYLSLEHRAPDAMSAEDRELLQVRKKELVTEAEFYGYDITTAGWIYDQAICPQLPSTILLHYLNKFPDGSESLFTALVPRSKGRVRIVPVLYRNAAPYLTAVQNPRNYAVFNELVPGDIAQKDVTPEGKWLVFGVCYAEMVGGRPNVPDEPSLDTATIKAPVALYRFDTATQQRQVQFSDRDARKVFKVWAISFNAEGRVTKATNEDYDTYVAHIVQPPAPPGTTTESLPPARVTTNPPDPPSKITPVPPSPAPEQ
jgi:hypothetical protein